MLDGALLQGAHALSAGRAARAPTAVPALPCGVLLELRELKRCPGAVIDLVHRGHDLHRDIEMRAEDRCRLLGSPLRARLDRRRAGAYQHRATRHLPATLLIELH